MEIDKQNLEELRIAVCKKLGREIHTPKDFDFLAQRISEESYNSISSTTLKRVWNYLNSDTGISTFTLNTLSRYIGYLGWEAFIKREKNNDSEIVRIKRIQVKSMVRGEKYRICWEPNREMLAIYEGSDLFTVTKIVNSSTIRVGDRFQAYVLREGEPMFLHNLFHEGAEPVDYLIGKKNGIRFDKVSD